MPSKKRKYNARFPAGRIKKIMQTDEEVGKVAQAVPIIISRTLELFVESLLTKAMQVTMARNAKTLSPSHVKQCILGESRFDFLRDLVKNIPDVSAAEEKETMSAESSPNSSRFSDMTVPPRRIAREDSNSSSSCDVRPQPTPPKDLKRALSIEPEQPNKTIKIETKIAPITPTIEHNLADTALDLTKKEDKPVRSANFYQETLLDDVSHRSVITANPTYSSPQPSTSYTTVVPKPHIPKIDIPVPKLSYERRNSVRTPVTPITPVTPVINIDFSKNLSNPEIKVLDTTAGNIVNVPKLDKVRSINRSNSKSKIEVKKVEIKPVLPVPVPVPVDIDHLNSGNLQIDEDYDT